MSPKQIQIDCITHKIAADWYDAGAEHTVLFIPGYTSSKKNYVSLVQGIMSKANINACVIDLGGHGESPFVLDDIRMADNFGEVMAAFDWVAEQSEAVSVVGTSYGGFMAMSIAKYRSFKKLILRVPAMYEPERFYTRIGNLKEDIHAAEYRKNQELIAQNPILLQPRQFDGKSYVLIHEHDEFIPLATTDAYIAALSAESYTAIGLPHGLGAANLTQTQQNDYQTVIADWLTA